MGLPPDAYRPIAMREHAFLSIDWDHPEVEELSRGEAIRVLRFQTGGGAAQDAEMGSAS